MFGYVRPRTDRLAQAELERYREAYCGLCHALGKQYGFLARFLVNYDMSFLYLLRASIRAPASSRSYWCPGRVCGSRRCTADPEGFKTVAACTVILCVEKLRDNIRDEGFFRTIPDRCLCLLYRRAYRRAAKRLPDFADLTAAQLQKLRELEEERSSSIDAVADSFAKIVAACAADLEEDAIRRPMEQLLYQTGRFLYLSDALDDLREDCKKGTYNPLRFRFSPENGELHPQELEYLTQLTDASVNLAGSALALLPLCADEALLENIVYLGMPSVFAAVKAHKFQAKTGLLPHGTPSKNDVSNAKRRNT